ncbi:MAG: sporulation membrane protein YtaF [Heliobacteriaceae bacterium]|nr:sporulation membrane protein YtaF [Heliobacteriaceae bacterium]MDD4587819.1 sporulation membrane protein YtaF [Heliobacteriaceae bacterium]
MSAWSIIGLAFALSLDGFCAGVAYGIKRIRLPFTSLLVICLCSTSAMGVALLAGQGLTALINVNLAGKLGGGILVLLGVFHLYNTYKGRGIQVKQELPRLPGEAGAVEPILSISLGPFGLVIQVLKEPTRADLDRSGELGLYEAFLLGLALSMDAFGAGLGVSLAGACSVYIPFVVGLTQLGLVTAGLCWGYSRARWAGGHWIAYLAGVVLLALGTGKLL